MQEKNQYNFESHLCANQIVNYSGKDMLAFDWLSIMPSTNKRFHQDLYVIKDTYYMYGMLIYPCKTQNI